MPESRGLLVLPSIAFILCLGVLIWDYVSFGKLDKVKKENETPAANRYIDETNGFSIVFPAGWKTEKSTNVPYVAVSQSPDQGKLDPYLETIQVAVKKLDQEMNWDQFAKMFAGGFKARPGSKFNQDVFGQLKIDGLNVRRFGGSFRVNGATLAYLAYATVKNDRGYAVVCFTVPSEFDKYKYQFERTVKTLKIK